MSPRIWFCSIALLFIVSTSTTAWPQGANAMGSIVGIVRVLRGDFPQPVLVSLELHGAAIASAYTDHEGRFNFNMIIANMYRVTIRDEHYQPASVEVNVRPDVMPISLVNLILVPRSGSSARPASGQLVVSSQSFSARYPRNAIREFERGVKLENEGKDGEAMERYRKAIKEAPNFGVAHNNLGSLYVGKSDFANAQKEFEESMRLDPSDSKPYFNMANLMLLTGKLEQAQRYLEEGFRKQPNSAFGFFVQGSVLERSGKFADAERALRRALELNPKLTRPHLELMNLYLREGQTANAIAELHKFLQEAPTDPLAPRAREVLKELEASSSPQSRQ